MTVKSPYDKYEPKDFEVIKITNDCVHLSQKNTRLVLFFYFNEKQELVEIEFEESIASWGSHIGIYEHNRKNERWIAHENVWKKFKKELNLDYPATK